MPEQDPEGGPRPNVDLNAASATQLETLPGIGPVYAAAILLARTEHGPFRSPHELVSRGVIPERVLDGIRDRASSGDSSPLGTPLAEATQRAASAGAAGRRVWQAARASVRALRSRRARIGYGVGAAVLAVGALPISMLVTSIGDNAQPLAPAAFVADTSSEAPTDPPAQPLDAAATLSPSAPSPALVSAAPTAVPVPATTTRYIGNTDGDGVSLRTSCEDEARTAGGWIEGTEVLIEERGTGSCFTWSLVRNDDTTSWVRNVYLVEEGALPIVIGTSARLPNAGLSRAQEHCIDYRLGGSYYRVCRTFPTLERSLWTPWDLGTYGHLSYQRVQYFADCYVNNIRVGAPLDTCAFTHVDP